MSISMKTYSDKREGAVERELIVGDKVLFDQLKSKKIHNKYLNQFESVQYKVVDTKGAMITVEDANGRRLVRDISFFKKGEPIKDGALNYNEVLVKGVDLELDAGLQVNQNLEQGLESSSVIVSSEAVRKSARVKMQTKFLGIND